MPTGDIDGDYHVTMLEDGDWIEYTIRTTVPGLYDLSLRVAGSQPGSVSIDALVRDVTGIWSFPSTGGAATWQTITRRVLLGPGQQILRVNVLKGGFNLNWIELAPAPAGPVVDGIYKILNRATGRAIGIGNESRLVTGNYTGAAHQQWTFQHIGGGQYRIRSTDNGQSWNNFGKAPHVTPWWGAGQDQSFIVVPTDSGFFRFLPAGTGKSLQPSTDEAPLLDREVYTGAGEQQWVIIPASVPPFPTGVTATESGSTSAIIRWNAVSGATGYLVQRATSPDGPFTTIAQVTTTSRTDTGLSAGTQYYYRVKAVGSGGESLPSVRSAPFHGTAGDDHRHDRLVEQPGQHAREGVRRRPEFVLRLARGQRQLGRVRFRFGQRPSDRPYRLRAALRL